MAKWTKSKNLSVSDRVLLSQHEVKSDKQLHILWLIIAVLACVVVYNIK